MQDELPSNPAGQAKNVAEKPFQNDGQDSSAVDLKTTSTMLYNIIDGIKGGAAVYGADDRLVYFNNSYASYFTLVRDTLKPGVSFSEIFEALAQRDLVQGSIAEKRAWVATRTKLFHDGAKANEFQRIDGSWVSIDYYKLEDGGTFVVITNITERKQADEKLRESEESLQKAQRIAKVGNVRWSFIDRKFISCSEEYARILGTTGDKIGQFKLFHSKLIVHPEDYQKVMTRFRKIQSDESQYEDEYRVVMEDGDIRDVLEIGEIIRDPSGKALELVGTLQDITQQKQIDRDRTVLTEERTRDQKLKAMGQLSAGIAHEINSPTQFIGDFLYFLKCSYCRYQHGHRQLSGFDHSGARRRRTCREGGRGRAGEKEHRFRIHF